MASIDCLWRNLATVFIGDLVVDDSAFCFWNAMDNSYSLQCSHSISHNVLLLKRWELIAFYCFLLGGCFGNTNLGACVSSSGFCL